MERRSYQKDGVTRSEANHIIRQRKRKWNTLWIGFCIVIFLAATYLYWSAIGSFSLIDKAHTSVNIMLAMATSGMVIVLYRIPKVRNMDTHKLECSCLGVIILCIIVNICLSIAPNKDFTSYLMTVLTGIGTGAVSLLYTSFDKTIEKSDEKDQQWIRRCPRNKKK